MDHMMASALVVLGSTLFLLGTGMWVSLTLLAVGMITLGVLSPAPMGSLVASTLWDASWGWALTSLPLFIWMGEILFRTNLASAMFTGLAPWLGRLPGGLLHVNILGCGTLAAVTGSSAVTCATIGRLSVPELQARGYPEKMTIGSLAGSGTLGLLIPPSIIMIVYGVTADVSIARLFVAGIFPGIVLGALFSGYIALWALLNKQRIPVPDQLLGWRDKIHESRHLIPVVVLIGAVLGSIYTGIATATEAAAIGVVGSLAVSAVQGSLNWATFRESLLGATRLYCMIALILAGAAFLTLSMGYIGLPRHLAEFVGSLGLSPFMLMVALALFYILLGCFLDGISMVVLTMGVILPTVQAAGFDLVWFGIFLVVVVEMAQITPPVGFNLFVLQGMTGKEITWISRVTFPFFLLMCLMVLLLWFVPGIATWLPSKM